MPKSSKKTPARKAAGWLAQQSPQTDFTLAEFADATPSATTTGRMKKSATKRWDKNVTELCVKSRDIGGNEELAWYEKELSDFDSEETTEYRSDEESETGYGRKVRKKKAKMVERFTGGTDYPYDLWCLIGDYIEPQCVAKFAVICKTSYTVVNTARFWSKLYQRHYVEDCGLPEELKPRYMEKAHGLRTRVIRSLFYFYTPLVARVHNINPFDDEPDILLASRCVLMWYRKFKGYWKFYFKFQRWQPKITSETQHSDDTHNRLRRFEPQVDHNPEQNFTVLQVTTLHYVRLPMIMGQQLVKTSISVGHGMRYHKIKMIFSPLNLLNSCSAGQSQLSTSITSVIDQVASVRVLPWWDPKYPYNSSMQNSQ